jgi:hypothetical protein
MTGSKPIYRDTKKLPISSDDAHTACLFIA